MKSFIITLALLAVTYGEDACIENRECMKEGMNLVKCIASDVKAAAKEYIQDLHNFKTEMDKCFNTDCPKPAPPSHVQAACQPQTKMPAEFVGCGKAVMEALKSGPKCGAVGHHENHQEHGRDHFIEHRGHPMNFNLMQIKAAANKLCKNNSVAATAFLKCAFTAAVQTGALKALYAFSNPLILPCHAAANCSNSNPLSDVCKTKFENMHQAACNCTKSAIAFANATAHELMKTNVDCQKVQSDMEAAKAAMAKWKEAHANATSIIPTPPSDMPKLHVDICEPCKSLAQWEAEMKLWIESHHKTSASA